MSTEMRKSANRFALVMAALGLGFFVVVARVAYLSFSGSGSASSSGEAVLRGSIQDRRGFVLARTAEWSIIALAPDEIQDREQVAEILGQRLQMSPGDIVRRIESRAAEGRRYFYLKRQVDNLVADQIMDLNLPGVHREREDRRIYPAHTLASNLIGFVGPGSGTDVAMEGLERDFHDVLLERDARSTHEGLTLQLTLDAIIQHRLEREMTAAFQESNSIRAAGIFMDIQTGQVLAMVSLPNYDPNRYSRTRPFQRGNWNIRLNHEPGSTVKVFMAAILLSEGAVRRNERFYCDGEIHFHNSIVRCRFGGEIKAHGYVTLEDIIEKSCNVGIIRAMQRVPPERFYSYMNGLGFGDKTGILPAGSGETSGYLPAASNWVPSTSYYMPIGQGFSVTPIQLLRAGASLANGGTLWRPYVANRVIRSDGSVLHETTSFGVDNPFDESVNREVLGYMRRVVTNGTARATDIPEVAIAGKTGTPEKSSAQGYLDKYMASFMGFFPADNPRYGGLIIFDEGDGNISGGGLAAPVFGRVVRAILPYLDDTGEALRPEPLPDLPVVRARVDPNRLHDFRGMAARDAIDLVNENYEVEIKLEGSGYVYAQEPDAGTPIGDVQTLTLFLDALR